MNKKYLFLIVPLFLLLLSYKVVLSFTETTPMQDEFLENKELTVEYAADELAHMKDVTRVMLGVEVLFYVLLSITTLVVTYYQKNTTILIEFFRRGGIYTVVLILFIFILTILSFDTIFTIFHYIFFPQGNWTFPVDSLLLQTFPQSFFMSISRNIFLTTLALGSIFIGLGYYLNHVHSNRN